MNAFFSFDLFMGCMPECKQQRRTPLEISGNSFMGHSQKAINLPGHVSLDELVLFHTFKYAHFVGLVLVTQSIVFCVVHIQNQLVYANVQLQNCIVGFKQQSLTHSLTHSLTEIDQLCELILTARNSNQISVVLFSFDMFNQFSCQFSRMKHLF